MSFAQNVMAGGSAFSGGLANMNRSETAEVLRVLRENSEAVMKSTVGYPSQGVGYTGALAPLVPQSIQGTLDSKTYTKDDLVLFKMLAQTTATSTKHEYTVVNEHGNSQIDPWLAEGGVSPVNDTTYERRILDIKYLAEHAEISDVSSLVGIVGTNSNMLAERTERATDSLLGKVERQLVHADSALTPLAFDGIIKQITDGAPDNVKNYNGAAVTPQDLMREIAEAQSDPNWGRTSIALVDTRVHSALGEIATAHGRYPLQSGGQTIKWGASGLEIVSGKGPVPVVSMPLINAGDDVVNSTTLGSSPPTALATYTPTLTSLGATTGSLFAATDAGAYRYKIVGVGDGGVTAPVSLGPISIATGDAVRITIPDTIAAGSAALRYYRVYRSPLNGGVGTETLMGSYAVNNDGAPDTYIDDANADRPKTSPALLLDLSTMEWVRLLDFMRRPLAQTQTTIPFLLMIFGAMNVRVPTKNFVLKNCARSL